MTDLIKILQDSFGDRPFTVRQALDAIPVERLPEKVARARNQLISMATALQMTAGVEKAHRTFRDGQFWRLNPDAPATVKGFNVGRCQHCLTEVASVPLHERTCAARKVPSPVVANTYAEEVNEMAQRAASLRTQEDEIAIERAGAHAASPNTLRASQRFVRVTDENVARAMHLIESVGGTGFRLSSIGRWYAPEGLRTFPSFSQAVQEMIRTGLVRHVVDRAGLVRVDYLVPAPVHFVDTDHTSTCKFVGEDMGPMRSRLTTDLPSVDCERCLKVISTGELVSP